MRRYSFANLYRPRTFEEVYGQDSVVACLSGLIQRGQIGRNILLHGSVGSGKTSLAWIYAKALNCEAPAADGLAVSHLRNLPPVRSTRAEWK